MSISEALSSNHVLVRAQTKVCDLLLRQRFILIRYHYDVAHAAMVSPCVRVYGRHEPGQVPHPTARDRELPSFLSLELNSTIVRVTAIA